jgi:hypothetical protein
VVGHSSDRRRQSQGSGRAEQAVVGQRGGGSGRAEEEAVIGQLWGIAEEEAVVGQRSRQSSSGRAEQRRQW